jgi:predicted DsbA family dithiol-disulfide isomerase
MKIDIWSDISCPYCYIGKRHLEAALETFPHKDQVEVIWHSFELDREAPLKSKETLYERIGRKYGVSAEQAKANTTQVATTGKAAGLDIDFDKVVPTNTFNAHRLVHLANSEGKQDAMKERLFKAYFIEGKNVGDKDTLQALATEVGIDATKVLSNDTYTAEVRKDEQSAETIGIRGVPFFVFDFKYAISGAHPVKAFEQTLQKVWDEAQPVIPAPVETTGGVCEDGTCTV